MAKVTFKSYASLSPQEYESSMSYETKEEFAARYMGVNYDSIDSFTASFDPVGANTAKELIRNIVLEQAGNDINNPLYTTYESQIDNFNEEELNVFLQTLRLAENNPAGSGYTQADVINQMNIFNYSGATRNAPAEAMIRQVSITSHSAEISAVTDTMDRIVNQEYNAKDLTGMFESYAKENPDTAIYNSILSTAVKEDGSIDYNAIVTNMAGFGYLTDAETQTINGVLGSNPTADQKAVVLSTMVALQNGGGDRIDRQVFTDALQNGGSADSYVKTMMTPDYDSLYMPYHSIPVSAGYINTYVLEDSVEAASVSVDEPTVSSGIPGEEAPAPTPVASTVIVAGPYEYAKKDFDLESASLEDVMATAQNLQKNQKFSKYNYDSLVTDLTGVTDAAKARTIFENHMNNMFENALDKTSDMTLLEMRSEGYTMEDINAMMLYSGDFSEEDISHAYAAFSVSGGKDMSSYNRLINWWHEPDSVESKALGDSDSEKTDENVTDERNDISDETNPDLDDDVEAYATGNGNPNGYTVRDEFFDVRPDTETGEVLPGTVDPENIDTIVRDATIGLGASAKVDKLLTDKAYDTVEAANKMREIVAKETGLTENDVTKIGDRNTKMIGILYNTGKLSEEDLTAYLKADNKGKKEIMAKATVDWLNDPSAGGKGVLTANLALESLYRESEASRFTNHGLDDEFNGAALSELGLDSVDSVMGAVNDIHVNTYYDDNLSFESLIATDEMIASMVDSGRISEEIAFDMAESNEMRAEMMMAYGNSVEEMIEGYNYVIKDFTNDYDGQSPEAAMREYFEKYCEEWNVEHPDEQLDPKEMMEDFNTWLDDPESINGDESWRYPFANGELAHFEDENGLSLDDKYTDALRLCGMQHRICDKQLDGSYKVDKTKAKGYYNDLRETLTKAISEDGWQATFAKNGMMFELANMNALVHTPTGKGGLQGTLFQEIWDMQDDVQAFELTVPKVFGAEKSPTPIYASKDGVDISKEGVDISKEDVYTAKEGTDPSKEGVDPTKEGVDPATEETKVGVDKSKEGVDTSKEGVDKSKEGVDKSKEGVDKSKEGVDTSKEGVDKSKEGVDKSKEGVDKSKEGVDVSKEGIDTSKEGVDTSKEGVDKSKEGVDVSKEGIDTSKEGVDTSKEGVDKSKEGVDLSKEGVDTSKEGVDKSKEGVDLSKEGVDTSKEGVDTSKEGVDKSKEGVDTSKEGVDLSKEGVDLSKEGVDTSKEGVDTSKEGVDTSKEGVDTSKEGVDTSKEGVDTSKEGVDPASENPTPPSSGDVGSGSEVGTGEGQTPGEAAPSVGEDDVVPLGGLANAAEQSAENNDVPVPKVQSDVPSDDAGYSQGAEESYDGPEY